MTIRAITAALVGALAVTALAACGDDSSTSTSAPATTAAAAATAAAPSAASVLSCLKAAGLDAKDQSSNTSGDTVGIDYSGGRTVIAFKSSASDADSYEIAAKSAGGEVLRSGTIVVSFADDTQAVADKPAIQGCVAG